MSIDELIDDIVLKPALWKHGDYIKAKQLLTALILSETRKARADELKQLNIEIATHGWHRENAYKMFPYILERLAELEKEKL
jgi:hypothetical protein